VTVHVPVPVSVTVLPETEQDPLVVKVTLSPESAVALTVKAGSSRSLSLRAPNVMVWFALFVVNVKPPEVPPRSDTVIVAPPPVTISLAGIEAVTWVLLTKVVVRTAPFQLTVVGLRKFDPFTVRMNALPPAVVNDGLRLVRLGIGGTTVSVTALEISLQV